MTKDSLSTYFENTRRSGGSGQVTVNVNRQQGYAIVTFESHVGKEATVLKTAWTKVFLPIPGFSVEAMSTF